LFPQDNDWSRLGDLGGKSRRGKIDCGEGTCSRRIDTGGAPSLIDTMVWDSGRFRREGTVRYSFMVFKLYNIEEEELICRNAKF
jgi:hypothetical protein